MSLKAERRAASLGLGVLVLASAVVATAWTVRSSWAGTHKTLAEYRSLNRAQAMRALGYAERAVASPLCSAMKDQAAALRRDLVAFYKVPDSASARDAATRQGTRAGAAEAAADMRQPRRYCDGLDEVLSVWRSYTLHPDTEYP